MMKQLLQPYLYLHLLHLEIALEKFFRKWSRFVDADVVIPIMVIKIVATISAEPNFMLKISRSIAGINLQF